MEGEITLWGVFLYDPQNMYRRASAVREYKRKHAAQQYAEKLGDAYVVRSIYVRRGRLTPKRWSDEQVREMLAAKLFNKEALLAVAEERGWTRPSTAPIADVIAYLRSIIDASPGD